MTVTVSELVTRARFENEVSAGAAAAEASLLSVADAADQAAGRVSAAQQRMAASRAMIATGPDPGVDWLAAIESGRVGAVGAEKTSGRPSAASESTAASSP
jgi:hypothetical protein